MTPDRVVAEARAWIGTPYRHGGASRLGCDCLGLVAGVAEAVTGRRVAIPHYAPDWAEATGREVLWEALEARLRRGEAVTAGTTTDFSPGDILLFRWRSHRPASHLGIATGPATMVHAHARAAVAEVTLGAAWLRRVVAVYRCPEAP